MKVSAYKPSRECYCGISRDYFSKNGKLIKLKVLDIFTKSVLKQQQQLEMPFFLKCRGGGVHLLPR